MIIYWPQKQGVELNLHVSNLFKKVYIKLHSSLYNKTAHILSIDIVNSYFKQELFKIILLELEILILDIIELDIDIQDISRLNHKLLIDLVVKSMISCQNMFKLNLRNIYLNPAGQLLSHKRIFLEHRLLLQSVLAYLIFGTSGDPANIYLFPKDQIPAKHVEILLDNLVIQIADIVFYELINSTKSTLKLFDLLKVHNICRTTYVSARSVATFRNNLVWYNYSNFYFKQPRIIYNNRYQVWIFSNKGLHCQYIYASREDELKLLSHAQFVIIVLLELQDFLAPKLQNLILLIGKLWIYLVRYVISNSLKVLLKSISIVIRSR
uniref:Uncharacterized protein n=1 Tax=Scinaia undulata TaxID=1884664 RepID=A0A1G4NXS6_9FLOR|nr:Hypothetical protein ycf55 [Scinaia undulata]SCW23306.1 Hypothetical protein ycf55 [Scinaia undulata]